MAKYPFDARFAQAIKNLPGHEGEVWDYLINVPFYAQGPIFDGLANAGYSPDIVSRIIIRLFKKPVAELFVLAQADDLESSPALLVLQKSHARAVFEHAVALTESATAKQRALGVLVLMRTPGITYLPEAIQAIKKCAARETDDTVVAALAYALRHLNVHDRATFLRRVKGSADPATRFAIAYSLADLNDKVAIETKIALSTDQDDDVRDWATFNLHLGLDGEMRKRQEIRDAFFARLSDSHEETRYEAIVGLAICKDERVLPILIAALNEKDVWDLAIEAAKELSHPSLLPALAKLRTWWGDGKRPDLLDQAIDCCKPGRVR